MAIRVTFLFVFLSVILMVGAILLDESYGGGDDKLMNHKSSNKEDMITVYKKGKEIRVTPVSIYFMELKKAIEHFTSNIDNGYELIPSEDRFYNLKERGYAIELVYASPKQLLINFFKKPILIKRIFIPVKGGNFPSDSVFIYEYKHEDFPHTLANTKQEKTALIKLVESIN